MQIIKVKVPESRMHARKRLAIIATHPIQYQVPIWRALAADPALEVEVFYATDMSIRGYRDVEFGRTVKWNVPLLEGYRSMFLSVDPTITAISRFRPTARGLLPQIHRFRPQVALLNAYGTLFWVQAFFLLRALGIPIIFRHEASDTAMARGMVKSVVRDCLLRSLYSRVSMFAAIGQSSRRHLSRLGVDESRTESSPYNVDSDLMKNLATIWIPQRESLRSNMGISPTGCALIFSGKLVPKKDPLLVLKALQLVSSAARERLHLLVIGDGVLRSELETGGREVLGRRFHCPGFVNQHELGRWYAAADCLVLPSRRGCGETWGLVVNEAFHFGLPAIVSDGVGCQPDLVTDCTTGRIFQSGNAQSLAQAIQEMTDELPARRMDYGALVRSRIDGFSTARAAEGLVAAVFRAVGIEENRMMT